MATWDGGIVKVNGRRGKKKRGSARSARRRKAWMRLGLKGALAAQRRLTAIRGARGSLKRVLRALHRNAPLSKTERRALKSILRKHRTRRNPWYLSEKGGTGNRLIRFGPFKTQAAARAHIAKWRTYSRHTDPKLRADAISMLKVFRSVYPRTGSPMKLRTTFSRKKYWPTDSQGVWIGRPRKRRSRR